MPACAPRAAAGHAFHGEPKTDSQAVSADGFLRVGGTGRPVTATHRPQERFRSPVESEKHEEKCPHHHGAVAPRAKARKSSRRSRYEGGKRLFAPFSVDFGVTTRSHPRGKSSLFRRKASRRRRLKRFRSTAEPWRRPTTRPKREARGGVSPRGRVQRTKCFPARRRPSFRVLEKVSGPCIRSKRRKVARVTRGRPGRSGREGYFVSFQRPFWRRRLITRRPPGLFMRARKPMVFLRRRLWG